MPLYENSIIYKLVHKNDQDNENIYVGSTTNFRGRKREHKRSCNEEKKKEYNYKVYQFIRENGGWDEWEMVAIETYPCENKREIEIRERFHIETLKPKLNKNIPTRTQKEYQQDNNDKLLEKKREKTTCECGCISTKSHLKRHRNSDKHKKKMEALAN